MFSCPATGGIPRLDRVMSCSHWVTAGGHPMTCWRHRLWSSVRPHDGSLRAGSTIPHPVVVLTDKELNLTQVTVDWPELPAPEPVTVVPRRVPLLLGENKIVRVTDRRTTSDS